MNTTLILPILLVSLLLFAGCEIILTGPETSIKVTNLTDTVEITGFYASHSSGIPSWDNRLEGSTIQANNARLFTVPSGTVNLRVEGYDSRGNYIWEETNATLETSKMNYWLLLAPGDTLILGEAHENSFSTAARLSPSGDSELISAYR